MSETNTTETPAPESNEPSYGDPVTKSDVGNALGGDSGAEPAEPAEPKAEEPAPEPKPEPKRVDPRDVRIRQLSARTAAEARRADALAAELSELRARAEATAAPKADNVVQPPQAVPQPRNQAEFDRMVSERAEQLAAQKAFAADCNKIAAEGTSEYKDEFVPTIQSLWGMVDGLDASGNLTPKAVSIIEAAMETDKPAAILHHLGKNPEDAVRIAGLSPAKLGAAVAKLAVSMAAAAAAPKPQSRAPAPLEPVGGNNTRADGGPLGPRDITEWMRWEDARVKAARGR